MRIFSFLPYDEPTLIDDLQNKLNNRLQNALNTCLIEFKSLDKLKIYLQRVNNKQRATYQQRGEQRTVKPMAVSKKRFVPFYISASAASYVRLATLSGLEPDRFRMSITYFICKVPDHLFKDCSQLKADTSAPHTFTL